MQNTKTYIVIQVGDWNARAQKVTNKYERQAIGKHTFNQERVTLRTQGEEAAESRMKLIDYCIKNGLQISNTYFQKTDEELPTYRAPGVTGPPYDRIEGKTYMYESLDYVLIGNR